MKEKIMIDRFQNLSEATSFEFEEIEFLDLGKKDVRVGLTESSLQTIQRQLKLKEDTLLRLLFQERNATTQSSQKDSWIVDYNLQILG
jgi:hypothetical protein